MQGGLAIEEDNVSVLQLPFHRVAKFQVPVAVFPEVPQV